MIASPSRVKDFQLYTVSPLHKKGIKSTVLVELDTFQYTQFFPRNKKAKLLSEVEFTNLFLTKDSR